MQPYAARISPRILFDIDIASHPLERGARGRAAHSVAGRASPSLPGWSGAREHKYMPGRGDEQRGEM